jgi:hypothetical protein
MNLTYAYKHRSVIDPDTGHVVRQANFALPKFIYLLGHDLIDVRRPEETLATIEIANHYGIPAVKEMRQMLASGNSLDQINARFPIMPQAAVKKDVAPEGKNGVIAKGSTVQLDAAPIANASEYTDTPRTEVAAATIATNTARAAEPLAQPALSV